MDLYVTGGQQEDESHKKEARQRYIKGIILRIAPGTDAADVCVEYVSPAAVCADGDPSILFKAGSLDDDKLHVCTETEVLTYQLPDFRRIGYMSLPCFNDVHHVCSTPRKTLLVVSTGLDMVVEVSSEQGAVLRQWNVLGDGSWGHFSPDIDYRKVASTKPHGSHPNYVFEVADEVWVTRFEQKDAVCLTRPGERIEIGMERPHDGLVRDGCVYYTTVNGHIIVADLTTRRREQVINLNEVSINRRYHPARPLGWCRGLCVLDPDNIIVGFTRLRSTRWRENVRWAKRTVGLQAGNPPTRIALYNLKRRALEWEVNLEQYGMDAVFSILAAP